MTIAVEQRGPIAEIRLSRPERGNPIDAAFLDELDAAAALLHDNATVRAVLLTAEGEVFSHGWDAGVGAPQTRTAPPFRSIELMGQPVIAAIEGDAISGGLELALACDARIAAAGATFALPEVSMGTGVRGGGTQRLQRLAGRSTAAWMILLGEPLDAAEALRCGLVNRVCPRDKVRAQAELLAARICERGPTAVRYAKEAILHGLDMPLDQALRYETDLTVILQTTADRAEGVRAFLEKRRPKFEGR